MTASIYDGTGLAKHAKLYITYSTISSAVCLYETFPSVNNYIYRNGSQNVVRFLFCQRIWNWTYFIYLIYCNFYKEDLCLILRSIMLFSSVNGYRINVIALSSYGRLAGLITFLLCNYENMFWSCDLTRSGFHDAWLNDLENFFSG